MKINILSKFLVNFCEIIMNLEIQELYNYSNDFSETCDKR